MKKLSFFALVVLILVSCSNDDTSTNATNPEVTITGYKIVSKSALTDGSNSTFEYVITGNLQNGKLFSKTVQNFTNGVSQGEPETIQDYFYQGNLLIAINDNLGGERKREFYYDNQGRLIGAKKTDALTFSNVVTTYYRFINISNSKVYFERLTKPYNDPTAEIQFRNILEFDENNNIIKAGRDLNFDGVSENVNQFTYSNNNLVSIQKFEGAIINFNYSTIIDTSLLLGEKSLGRRLQMILESELFTNGNLSFEKFSKNLISQEITENTYEVLSNNFFKKKIQVNTSNPNYINTITTEYFFE